MNFRKLVYFSYANFRGYKVSHLYRQLQKESSYVINIGTTQKLLKKLLIHCQKNVPYYADYLNQISPDQLLMQEQEQWLTQLPILTKDIIRENFQQLQSVDLAQRKWYFNTSGGSTGEPIKIIQDQEYADNSEAITLLYSHLVGRELGELQAYLWGSEQEIIKGTKGYKANFFNFISNTIYLNAFRMTPESMRSFIQFLNAKRPQLIIAYAQAIYELAKFAENENIQIISQKAIITSAGTLYPWMRDKIEMVFQCQVFNRYGSREVSNIACERPGYKGLWAAPWGNYIEIVDDNNEPVPAGVEGNILITCLKNFAMPLIRYKIGDRGTLSAEYHSGQILQYVTGRNVDTFKTPDGTLIDGEYFTHLLYFRKWVKKFQIIQKSYSHISIKIIQDPRFSYQPEDLNDIICKCKKIMGETCMISFEFVNNIPHASSGKYRYTISEI